MDEYMYSVVEDRLDAAVKQVAELAAQNRKLQQEVADLNQVIGDLREDNGDLVYCLTVQQGNGRCGSLGGSRQYRSWGELQAELQTFLAHAKHMGQPAHYKIEAQTRRVVSEGTQDVLG